MDRIIKLFKLKSEKIENEIISNITDNFSKGKYITLSNGEIIQLIGYIEECPYFLFSFDPYKFYLKYIKNIGFSIVYDTVQLTIPHLNIGKVEKLPNIHKLSITTNLINNIDNINIFNLEQILKIGHINTVYTKNNNDQQFKIKKSINNSEYLLIYNEFRSILSFSILTGYSILNKV